MMNGEKELKKLSAVSYQLSEVKLSKQLPAVVFVQVSRLECNILLVS